MLTALRDALKEMIVADQDVKQDNDQVGDQVADQDSGQYSEQESDGISEQDNCQSIEFGEKELNIIENLSKKTLDIINDFLNERRSNNDQVNKLLYALSDETLSAVELMKRLNLKHRPTFRKNYLKPALAKGLIVMTIPDKPNSKNQKYRRKK